MSINSALLFSFRLVFYQTTANQLPTLSRVNTRSSNFYQITRSLELTRRGNNDPCQAARIFIRIFRFSPTRLIRMESLFLPRVVSQSSSNIFLYFCMVFPASRVFPAASNFVYKRVKMIKVGSSIR